MQSENTSESNVLDADMLADDNEGTLESAIESLITRLREQGPLP